MKIDKWSWLALMRFFLALIVAVNHLAGDMPLGPILGIFPKLGAFQAIMGFLLISGYSIGESYLNQPHNFFARRAMRIYPVYLAAILLTWLVSPQTLDWSFFALLVLNVLFLNQVFIDYSYVGPAWTLSLEVWLYALAPWFSKQSTRLLRWFIFISFVAFAFYTAGRSLFHWNYYSGVNWGLNLLFLSYTWIAGFLLAKDPAARKSTMRLIAVLFILEIAVEAVIQLGYRMKHHHPAIFFQEDLSGYAFMGVTLLIVWLVFRKILEPAPAGAVKKNGWMRLLGDISYPLYLTHMRVFDLLPRLKITNPYLATVIAVLVAFAVYLLVDFYSQRREKRKTKAALLAAA